MPCLEQGPRLAMVKTPDEPIDGGGTRFRSISYPKIGWPMMHLQTSPGLGSPCERPAAQTPQEPEGPIETAMSGSKQVH